MAQTDYRVLNLGRGWVFFCKVQIQNIWNDESIISLFDTQLWASTIEFWSCYWKYFCTKTPFALQLSSNVHSFSKCLVWVKMYCHVWLDQNLVPFLLTNKYWLVLMEIKQKNRKIIKWAKKNVCFIPMKTSQSLLVCKDGSKFWSSQPWQHFLTQTKHFEGECTIWNSKMRMS